MLVYVNKSENLSTVNCNKAASLNVNFKYTFILTYTYVRTLVQIYTY